MVGGTGSDGCGSKKACNGEVGFSAFSGFIDGIWVGLAVAGFPVFISGLLKLVAVRGHRGGPRRKGRRERRGRGGGSGELGDRGSAGSDKMAGRWKDGRLGERSRRRKAEGSTGRGKGCEKTGP